MSKVVVTERQGSVLAITLNRPEVRNAINRALAESLVRALEGADADPEVAVVILTGADPAFCAGLDLKELAERGLGGRASVESSNWYRALRERRKPVIGAINGPAVTGGLEIALNCDFLVASERASFADTHGRVGAMPGAGLTALLPQAAGIRMAKEMSFTGNFVDAPTALAIGLVNHVVPHDELLPFTSKLAEDIASNDQEIVTRMKKSYDDGSLGTLEEALALEARAFREWSVSPSTVERRRIEIVERGRRQASVTSKKDKGARTC